MVMNKIRVGLISFSDGRQRVHETLVTYIDSCAEKISTELRKTGIVEIFPAENIVHGNLQAKEESLALKALNLDVVVFNVPVFAFPNLPLIAESILRLPTLTIAPINGKQPGLGGLLATVNLLHQNGYQCKKVWGDLANPAVLKDCMAFLRAAHTVRELTGQTFGLIGGRSIGIGTGVPSADCWQSIFGIDVDHMDQSEILRRSTLVSEKEVNKALSWLSEMTTIRFDGKQLTEDKLRAQIRCYAATMDICKEKGYAFIGVKCHYEMSEYNCTQCLSAAFFNDPYDWNGPKEPLVFSCEADAEGGLTMQIMKIVSGEPALFFDFRHINVQQNLFYFCNCGAMATWYAARSDDPRENLKHVTLKPCIEKYAGGGCHVQYIAKPGKMTFGRITHEMDKYIFTVFTGEAVDMPPETLEETCPQWPHLFVKTDTAWKTIVEEYECNHVHAVFGDYIDEIKEFCALKHIEFRLLV
jgi:L-fucose isomerase